MRNSRQVQVWNKTGDLRREGADDRNCPGVDWRVLWVYAGNATATRGTAWYAPSVTPVSGQLSAESPVAEPMPEAAKYAKGMSLAFRAAARKVMPSVVFITNKPAVARTSGNSQSQSSDDEGDDELPFKNQIPQLPFKAPFGGDLFPFPRGLPQTPHQTVVGVGSGVIVDPSGLVLTNNHVVAGGEGREVTIRLHDGREFKAVNIKTDPTSDLAILRIDGKGPFPAARLGESNDVEVGDWVLALGQPFGLEDTVTAGIISAKQRGLGAHGDYLQTDAAINPGNSGGPLVNLDGEVIGINTAIKSNTGAYQGVGFAIPSDTAKWVGGQLDQFGTVHRAYLGIVIQSLNQELAEKFNVPVNGGVLVAEVRPNTPAAKAGVKPGDVVLQFAGKAVSSPRELQAAVEVCGIGSTEPLAVLRDGRKMTLDVKCNEMPAEYAADSGSTQPKSREPARVDQLGIHVQNLTAEIADKLGLNDEHGVVVTEVRPGSPADMAGLGTGMVITEVNRHPVKTTADFEKAITAQSLAKGVLLNVHAGGGSRYVVIRVQ